MLLLLNERFGSREKRRDNAIKFRMRKWFVRWREQLCLFFVFTFQLQSVVKSHLIHFDSTS